MTAARHPNRTGLPATTQATDGDAVTVLTCRCPVTVLSGTAWAYKARVGWHDPVEHATWTPPRRQPTRPAPGRAAGLHGPDPAHRPHARPDPR